MEESPGTVSAAVREHLRQLCLREFPCGTGSWNRSRFLPKTWRTWRELVPRDEEMVSTEEEPVDALLGLVRSPHSPWALPKDSSKEDRFLRELAIKNPAVITDAFLYSYLRSLRVVDKKVSLVDRALLRFVNLEELVLSANHIKVVNASNLPPTLKVLELYGNEISSMKCLCDHPPPSLQHLGLGHNKLQGPLESLYITADYWPNLVSLDLGFNDLTNLQSVLGSLRTLRQLRLLVLQGNPLALVPYYRGLTVDSLPRLCVFDDVTVSPSEKHQFRGLSINGDLLAHEAQLVVTIGNLRGVLDTSLLDPEPGPEGPFISYSYYVTYDFLEEEEAEANGYRGVLAEVHGRGRQDGGESAPGVQAHLNAERQFTPQFCPVFTELPAPEHLIVKPTLSVESFPEELMEEEIEETEGSLESVALTELGELEGSVSVVGSTVLRRSMDSAEELSTLRPRIDPRLCPSPGTVLFSTAHKPWSNIITCSYEAHHLLRDLVRLKAFLLSGTTVTIVQEKIVSWPLIAPQVETNSTGKKGKPEKEKKGQDETYKKGQEQTRKAEKGGNKDQKKREIPKELQQDPPILKVLGSSLVALEPLLAGESVVSTICNFGVVRTVETDRLMFSRSPEDICLLERVEGPEKGVQDGSQEQVGVSENTLLFEEEMGDQLGDGPTDSKRSAGLPVEGDYQPDPLTVEVQIQLSQCRTAEEALRAFSV
ncbi:leucine-rich repeat-containing protein 43 [Rhynchocyon petersi]